MWYRRFAAMRFMLWRSCIGPPSQPKLALSLPIKGPFFCRLTVFSGSAAGGSENHSALSEAGEKVVAPATKGGAAEGNILYWRPQGAHLASAAILYSEC